MQISEEDIKKYQEIFFEEYGFEIERIKALNDLTALICLIGAVHRHLNNKNNANN